MAILPGRYLNRGGQTGELEVFGEQAKVCSTFTCQHCQKVTFVRAGCNPTDLGGFCWKCDQLICPKCVNKGTCDPWEEQMKRMEARYEFRKSAGILDY